MKIGGLQKLTLLDYPEVMSCIVFTDGCNFRCPFCHNAPLVVADADAPAETLTEEEVFAFLEKRKNLLDGVVITGGEPLIQPDIEGFIRRVRDLGYKVKLDTNGSFPARLTRLMDEKLVDYVAMDIKNSPARYRETAGVNANLAAVEESARLLLGGAVDYEFRTTVVKPLFDTQSFRDIGESIRGAKRYFLQKFKDSGNLIAGEGLSAYSDDEMRDFLSVVREYVPSASLR